MSESDERMKIDSSGLLERIRVKRTKLLATHRELCMSLCPGTAVDRVRRKLDILDVLEELFSSNYDYQSQTDTRIDKGKE